MSTTQLATEHVEARAPARVQVRPFLVSALGPFVALTGVVWAIVQPYRVTLLDPHGQGFWWLFVQPPLFVIAVGALFHVLVARPLVDDLEREE